MQRACRFGVIAHFVFVVSIRACRYSREQVEGSVVIFIDIVVYLRNVYTVQPSMGQPVQATVVLNENTSFSHHPSVLHVIEQCYCGLYTLYGLYKSAKYPICKTVIIVT